jgi:hypothetical protein
MLVSCSNDGLINPRGAIEVVKQQLLELKGLRRVMNCTQKDRPRHGPPNERKVPESI